MRSKQKNSKIPAERVVKDIRRAPRKPYSAEEKIRIVLEGLRGDDSIADLCHREGIAQAILKQRERIKRKTIEQRRLHHQRQTA